MRSQGNAEQIENNRWALNERGMCGKGGVLS